MRYIQVLESDPDAARISDVLAQWTSVEDINAPQFEYETPAGPVNGVNTTFVFAGTPVNVFINEALQSRDSDYSISDTHTVIFDTAPANGARVTANTLKIERRVSRF